MSTLHIFQDRIAKVMGGKAILPPAFEFLPGMVQDPNWKIRFGACVAICNIGEGQSTRTPSTCSFFSLRVLLLRSILSSSPAPCPFSLLPFPPYRLP